VWRPIVVLLTSIMPATKLGILDVMADTFSRVFAQAEKVCTYFGSEADFQMFSVASMIKGCENTGFQFVCAPVLN
jgi:hypothetical protein